MPGKEFQISRTSDQEYQYVPETFLQLWRIPFNNESDHAKLIIALRERIKELNCLYGISQLAERYSDSIEDLLKELVKFLPLSWQYPEITCARIVFKGESYKSKKFNVTKWRQTSRIFIYDETVGDRKSTRLNSIT